MRKVAGWLFSSLDGVVEAPNEWQFDFDEQMGERNRAVEVDHRSVRSCASSSKRDCRESCSMRTGL